MSPNFHRKIGNDMVAGGIITLLESCYKQMIELKMGNGSERQKTALQCQASDQDGVQTWSHASMKICYRLYHFRHVVPDVTIGDARRTNDQI